MKKGFTLPELIVTMSILMMLTGIVVVNLFSASSRTDINTAINVFIADLRSQQLKAMVGDIEGQGTNDSYGVYFNQTNYILFKGATYSPGGATNFTVDLPNQLEIANSLFAGSQIVFTKGSGEVVSFVSGSDSVTIYDPTSTYQKTITINNFGVITQVN